MSQTLKEKDDMSEDMKPKQFFKPDDFLLYEVYYGKSEENMVPKTIEQIAAKQANEKLEPTMRLMDDMAKVLKFYLEIKPFPDDGAKAFLALEKYKKFKDGLR